MFTRNELEFLFEVLNYIEIELDNTSAYEIDDYDEKVANHTSIKNKLNELYKDYKNS